MEKRLTQGGKRKRFEKRAGIWQRLTFERRKRAAERQAEDILRISGSNAPPVPEEIVRCLRNVSIEYLKWRELSGICENLDNRWIITLNSRESKRQQRFTLFHEMKHILDERVDIHFFQRRGLSTRQIPDEDIADAFASAILMPKAWIRAYWLKYEDVDKMARIFKVEKSEMAKRLASLCLLKYQPQSVHCSLIIWFKKIWRRLKSVGASS